MYKALAIIICLISCTMLNANNAPRIVDTTQFTGDRHGDFTGDFVAHLSDGSSWKVHPEAEAIETYSHWNTGDRVTILARTEWYWFKREHKFKLLNIDRNETVKAMILTYPVYSQRITSSNLEVDYEVPITNSSTGAIISWRQIYARIIHLTDGSAWKIPRSARCFTGDPVYIGFDDDRSKFFVILGTQREADWHWINKH